MTPIRLVFLVLGVALGSYLPFGAVIQSGKGFDPIGIGMVGALGATLAVVAAPIWGHLGDVALGRRRVLQLAGLGAAVALIGYGLGGAPIVLAALWVTASVFASTTNPTADAVAVVVVRGEPRASFARLRVLLSFAFGAAAIASGVLYEQAGYGAAPFVAAGAFVALVVVAVWVADPPRDAATLVSAGRRGGATSAAFAAQPRLPLVLLTFGLGMMGMIAAFGWLPLRIAELGGSPADVALAAGLEAFAEVPAFIVAGLVAARMGLRALYAASAVLMGACVLALAALTDPALMIGVRLLNGVAYAGITVASVSALGVLLPASLQSTGQSLSAMTGSVVGILLGLAGGTIYQLAGASALFGVTGLLTLASAVLAWAVLPGRVPSGLRPELRPGASSG